MSTRQFLFRVCGSRVGPLLRGHYCKVARWKSDCRVEGVEGSPSLCNVLESSPVMNETGLVCTYSGRQTQKGQQSKGHLGPHCEVQGQPGLNETMPQTKPKQLN